MVASRKGPNPKALRRGCEITPVLAVFARLLRRCDRVQTAERECNVPLR
jgi:hypothetical protein